VLILNAEAVRGLVALPGPNLLTRTGFMMRVVPLMLVMTCGVCISGCHHESAPNGQSSAAVHKFGQVDEARLAKANQEPDQWFTPGRDRAGSYYSPLSSINSGNVGRLGFAWDYKLGTTRGLEATPVVVDGVMYTTGNWGRVYALDAASGRELWTYDPQGDGQWGRYACCDAVNRGLAAWGGRIYVVSLDGYLHGIDAQTGQRIWRVDTLPERREKGFHYFVTGAPVLAGELIVIGNGGADFKGGRGSVSAYDLQSGAFKWRFYTVPRDPRLGPEEQQHLEAAVKTWPSGYDWTIGGGGTAWDGLAYDPDLRLVYLGTGNASPYHGESDRAYQGDQLFTASIIAVHVDTGEMAWYYQEVPGDSWDYDSTSKLTLADLQIDGRIRKVIMHAPKDGYFYVLDRATGEFLTGKPFVYINWTKGLDLKTHRPIKEPAADWGSAPALVYPSAFGAHSWQPMSFSPKTGLVYVPVIDAPMVYVNTSRRRAGLIEGNFELAFFFPEDYDPKELESLYGQLPLLETLSPDRMSSPRSRGLIRAIEPLSGQVVWEQQTASRWDGGVLSTGGNLAIQGDAAGYLNVYAADSGQLLKRIDVGTSILAAPMTYRVNGIQHVSVMAGYGGGALYLPFPKDSAAYRYGNDGRIVTFRLDGGVTPKPPPAKDLQVTPPPREGSATTIAQGEVLYNRYCSRCHAFGRALLPDLRRLPPEVHGIFYDIVLRGAYQARGMARWDDVLSREDVSAIHAYLVDQAWQLEPKPASAATRSGRTAGE
jgi:quinohemoprotein ethanol dehydrogenase